MKNILLVILFIIGFNQLCKADTLDYYHIYYNDISIGEFNLHNTKDKATIIKIDISNIKDGDQISLKYFRDFIIPNSNIRIIAEDDNQEELFEFDKNGKIYSFNLNKLKHKTKLIAGTTLCVRYLMTDYDKFNINYSLFYIHFE
jgi:hypothetical protein